MKQSSGKEKFTGRKCDEVELEGNFTQGKVYRMIPIVHQKLNVRHMMFERKKLIKNN